MNIIESTPEKILVSVDLLKSAISTDKEQKETAKKIDNSKSVFIACISGCISDVFSLISSWSYLNAWKRIMCFLICAAFFVVAIWFLIVFIQAKKKIKNINANNLDEYLVDEAKKKIMYTALIIICYQKADSGEVKFMTEKNGNYLVHCKMDPSLDTYSQKDGIINYLTTTYNIQKNHIKEILPLSEEPFFSIKPIHETETQNGFVFFQVFLNKKAKESLPNHKNTSWKSIQDMEKMPELMGRNKDIVMALDNNKTKIQESFTDFTGKIHVIWNITKRCSYNCAFCATHDELREELSTDDKLKVLDHIFSYKESIKTLDFAGGDPLCDEASRNIIIQAINSLGEERVSVTTTGKGIQIIDRASDDEISRLLSRCEITIDASHDNLAINKNSSFSRNSLDYCTHNYNQIKKNLDNVQYLVVNVPILDSDLEDTELNSLKEMLLELKNNYLNAKMQVQIIRLMPVGSFCKNDKYRKYYKEYNPIEIAKKIKMIATGIGIPCRYHCSLRILQELDGCEKHCSMLERKIGVDCNGNVFACPWGAYIETSNEKIDDNPFYLGNLVESNLSSILNGFRKKTDAYKRLSKDIANRKNKPYCEVVSWFFNNKIEENKDPLSIKCRKP